MSQEISGDKSLSKNAIDKFILKVDLSDSGSPNLISIAQEMGIYFDRTEKREAIKIDLTINQGNSEITNKQSEEVVLTSDAKQTVMTFSEINKCFWIETNRYIDNSIYKDFIKKTISTFKEYEYPIKSKRIGLRYINNFPCNKINNINKIYNKRLSQISKLMKYSPNQARIIGLEEYNYDNHKIRIHYGIPNKFYPAIISNFDLLLDIDAYTEQINDLDNWEDTIRTLNHAAYEIFIKEINPKHIESLK